jgi:hypothetical protein
MAFKVKAVSLGLLARVLHEFSPHNECHYNEGACDMLPVLPKLEASQLEM